MLKLHGLAAPPQLTGQGQHCELARQLQARTSVTQHVKLGACFPPEVSQCSHRGRGPFKEPSLTWSEALGLNHLASFPAGQHNGRSWGPDPSPGATAGALIPLIALQTQEVNHIGLDPKQDRYSTILISATHHVRDTWVSTGAPESGLLLRAGSQQQERHARDCPKHTQKCHILSPRFRLPIQCEEDVKQVSPWSQILKFLSNQWSV